MRLIAALAVLVATVSVAHAYPQFQLSHEAACSACHLQPTGGGLLNDYGRDEAGSTISQRGDGRFLHNAWDPPEWFAIGGDFRSAFAARRSPNERNDALKIWPMQADINLRVMKGDFAFAFTVGVRGVARADQDEQPVLLERLASREHYAVYTMGDHQVRAGRFYPIFGLRVADHTAYVRRFMGFNLYEEPYAVEYARTSAETAVHVTGFVPQPSDFLGSGLRRSGGIISAERQISDQLILGGQTRAAVGPHDAVVTLGGVMKRWFSEAELLLLGELDVQRNTFRGNGPGRTQVAGYLGASKWATRGVLLGSAVHIWEPDLTLRGTTRQAFDVSAQYFPWAHWEVHLLLRASAQGGTVEDPSYLALLMGHYYL